MKTLCTFKSHSWIFKSLNKNVTFDKDKTIFKPYGLLNHLGNKIIVYNIIIHQNAFPLNQLIVGVSIKK